MSQAGLSWDLAWYCSSTWTNARMDMVDRNWTKSGGRLFSHGRGFCKWVSLRKSHATRNDAVPGGYLHRT